MTDREIFNEVFGRLAKETWGNLTMKGALVLWAGETEFNTDGYNLGYNLRRLMDLLDRKGMFN